MADQISSMVVSVDSTSAKAAVSDLDKLAGAGDKAQSSVDQLGAASARAAESHHAVARAAAGYTKSAKELAFATRNLPAQFTDIAVSLQAGANPMTVLFQQGGQLKDMFGSTGAAARAMGGYVMGLVTPLTVTAAALTAIAVAAYQGDNEMRKVQKSLIMVGNDVGRTADDLVEAAEGMERFGRTSGKIVEALGEVAGSGKFTGGQIELVTQAALDLEQYGGVAIQDTVKMFASLKEDPVEAALKLNEEFGNLTVATYNQIQALVEQGDEMGAAEVAMNSLAASIEDKGKQIEGSLGYLQQSWNLVAGAAKAAWNAMLNVGRADTLQDQMRDLGDKIREVQDPTSPWSYAHLGAKGSKERQKYVAELRKQFKEVADKYVAEQREATRAMDEQVALQATASLDREIARGRSNKDKRLQAEAQIQNEYKRGRFALLSQGYKEDSDQILALEKKRDEALESARSRLADPKGRAPKKARKSDEQREAEREAKAQEREYDRLTKSVAEHVAILRAAGQQEEKLTDTQRWATKILADMKEGHTKLSPTQQATIQASIDEALALDRVNEAREKQNKLLDINADFNNRIASDEARRAAEQARDIRSMGHGAETNDLLSRMDEIAMRAAEDRLELAKKYGDQNAKNTQEYVDQLAVIDAAEQRQLQKELQYLAEKKAAAADWRNGARAAFEDMATQINDVAGQTRDGFMNAFSAMNSAIDQFARTGKASFKDLAKTILAELLKIELRILLSKALSSIFGSFGAGAGGGSAGYGSAAGPTSGFGSFNAYGTGNNGSLMPMALGGVVGGGVVTSPTLFPLANGATVLAGEQRPEAVMPLTRTADGRLGVASTGGGAGGMNVVVNTVVNVSSDGSADASVSSDDAKGRQLGDVLTKKIKDVLVGELQQGGILWASNHR